MNVASFQIDHDRLLRGIYVSRKDFIGDNVITTFDIRIKIPNAGDYLDIAGMHTMEHLMAVYLRGKSGDFSEKVIYVGPMGCRTGMYLVLKGDLEPEDILEDIKGVFRYMADFEGEIPATTSKECGNYMEHELISAKKESQIFYDEILANIKKENMNYPC